MNNALATNGLGHAVHALIMPAGWTQIGETRVTRNEALADMVGMPDAVEELSVKEVLSECAA